LFTASAVVLGAAVFWKIRETLHLELQERVQSAVRNLSDDFTHRGVHAVMEEASQHGRGSGALDYLVQSPDGKRLAGEIPVVGARRGWLLLTIGERGQSRTDYGFAGELAGGYVLVVAEDLHRVRQAEEAVLQAFAWGITATILLGACGGAWLSNLFLSRVDVISRTAEAIIGGDLTQRIRLRGTGDDLDRLGETLNVMLDRIETLLGTVRQVSNNIAHDLRTPLSRLGQHLEDARMHARSEADHQRALDKAKTEVEALLATFAALLRIAEIESGAQRAAFRRVDLTAIVETVAEAFAPSAEEESRSLVFEVAPGLMILGDQELLTQMLVNLVENALRHTPVGTRVGLKLYREGRYAVLVTEDNGPGIPEDERPLVLRHFYRLDQSRTTPGSGLGLSLVAAVAALHGADLRLEDAGPGLRISTRFDLPVWG
jgi:signal transduction histidine kinase